MVIRLLEKFLGNLPRILLFCRILAISGGVNGQTPSYVPSAGLVAWYPFTGNSADSSGNGRHLRTYNNPSLSSDRFGVSNRAYSFSAANGSYMLSNAFPTNYREYTIAAWVQIDSFHEYKAITSLGAPAGGQIFSGQNGCLANCTGTGLGFALGTQANTRNLRNLHCDSSLNIIENKGANNLKRWFHIAAVWTGRVAYLYINGKLTDSTVTGSLQRLQKGFIVGAGFFRQVYYHHSGKLDDIGVWSRALSSCEISYLYKSALPTLKVSIGKAVQSYCKKDTVQLNASSGFVSYYWNTRETTQQIIIEKSGWFDVIARDSFGCISGDTALVSVLNPIIGTRDTLICNEPSFTMQLTTPPGGFSAMVPPSLYPNLLAWYPFCKSSDDFGNRGHHGTVFGARLARDRFGVDSNAYAFNGSSDYISVGDPADNTFDRLGNPFTISLWVKTKQTTLGPLLSKQRNNVLHQAGDYSLELNTGVGNVKFAMGIGLSSLSKSSTASINNDSWRHVAAVYTKDSIDIYIDGKKNTAISNVISGPSGINNSPFSLLFGKGWMNNSFAGNLDDISFFNRALIPSEIHTLYSGTIYSWSNNDTGTSATVSGNGRTMVWVKADDGVGRCFDTTYITFRKPKPLLPADTLRLTSCDRDSLRVSISADWKGILWNNKTTDTVIWLKKTGRYSVTARDSLGCVASDSIWFVNPGKLRTTLIFSDSVRCNGGADGKIGVGVRGAFLPSTFLWNDPAKQKDTVATGLKEGTYKFLVRDYYGCMDSLLVTIYQPDLMYLTLGMNDSVDCFGGSDGALSALASGGTRPYRYVWNDPARQTSSTASGLKAGKYFVQVRDYNGCKDSMEIDLKEPDRVRISLLRNDSVRCFGGSDGSITVIASGGNGLYRYLWNDPAKQKTSTATGLPKGNWKVWAYDQYNCSDSAVLRMNEPASLRVSIASVDSVRCFAGADGRMQASGTGGTLPYSWLWNDPAAQRSQTVVNLARGRYLVRLTDAKGCTDTISRFVAEPTRLLAQISFTDSVRCFSGSDGRAMAQATGGNGGYQYLWNDQFRQTTALASNLFPGPYRVRVTDRKGCRDSVTATVHAPLPMILSILSDSVNCFGGSDGNLQVQVQQGRGPLSFSWTDPARQTGTRASNLRRGTYRVRVTDIRGCRDSMNGTVHEPAQLLAFIVRSDSVNCFGGADGALQGGGSGGSGGYRWQWNDPASQRTATAINLRPGTYIATLRDVYGCSDTAMGSVFQPTPVRISLSGIDSVRCFGGADGRIHTTAIGGSGGYRWRWNDPFGQLASTAMNLRRGTYKAVVRDVYGCSDSLQASVAEPERLDVAITRVDQISCFGGSDGALYSAASGGVPPITRLWNDPAAQRSANALNLRQGRYLVTVRDSKGCTDTASALVREPAPLNIRITQTFPVSCHRLSDAAANTVTSGGTTPYSWSWNSNPPQFTANASNLPAGKYRVVVRDFRGCSDSTEVTFDEPDPIIVQINGNRLTMYGMVHDLEATVLPVGRYTCNWTPQSVFGPGNGNSERPRGIFTESGTVKVIARNTKGCEGEDTAYFTVVLLPEDIMPTAFTPNIDNLNEGFGMPSIFDVEEFTVYDRWGAVVFRASPNQQRWDGRTASGVQVPSGSYTYRLRARLKGTQQYVTHTGKVSLIR